LAVVLLWRFGAEPATWLYLPFFFALLLGAIVDWQTQYLYDVITLPLGALGLLVSFLQPQLLGGLWRSPLAVLGMALSMLALQGLGRWLSGREALGGGDVKLMAAAAGFLGWPHAWLALLLGSLAGLPLMLLYRRVHGGAWKDPAPFGPALALGCAVAGWDRLAGGTALPAWMGFGPL
jgi:prepilin signal peptidase PulO-like enzyme (type II secretory pathway)